MKVSIQAVKRDGYPGYWTPGRCWQSDAPRVVEVLSQDDDPIVEVDEIENGAPTGRMKSIPDPHRIGQRTYKQALSSRTHLIVEAVPDDTEVGALSSSPVSVDELRASLSTMKGLAKELAEAKAELERLRAKAPRQKAAE